MQTWDAIRARRNSPDASEQSIASRDLDQLLEAGWRAPSPATD
jgi:hypothetical protein